MVARLEEVHLQGGWPFLTNIFLWNTQYLFVIVTVASSKFDANSRFRARHLSRIFSVISSPSMSGTFLTVTTNTSSPLVLVVLKCLCFEMLTLPGLSQDWWQCNGRQHWLCKTQLLESVVATVREAPAPGVEDSTLSHVSTPMILL